MDKKPFEIMSFAREAGGAAVIAPVLLSLMDTGYEVKLYSKDKASKVFDKNDIKNTRIDDIPEEDTIEYFNNHCLPDIIFTSAASLPELDMTEKYLWKWAKQKQIPSVAIIDQWQNYARRFSGKTQSEKLAYLPDKIMVMDKIAKSEMIEEGIPGEKIIITGHPAFDELIKTYSEILLRSNQIRSNVGIPEGAFIVSFVSESLKNTFDKKLGYDEYSTLEFTGDVLNTLNEKQGNKEIVMIIKLHPQNELSEFSNYINRWNSLNVIIVENEFSAQEIIGISNLVVGMTSILMIESILAGIPTVSLQLNSKLPSQLIATRTNAIPFNTTKEGAGILLTKLIESQEKREKYLRVQNKWKAGNDAVRNCILEIECLLNKNLKPII